MVPISIEWQVVSPSADVDLSVVLRFDFDQHLQVSAA